MSSIAMILVICVWVFCGALFLAGIVGLILFFANRPGSAVRRVGGAIGFVCGSILCGLVLLGGVIGFSAVRRVERAEVQLREEKAAELQRLGEELHRQNASSPPEPPPIVIAEGRPDAGLTRLPSGETAVKPVDSASRTTITGQDDRTNAGPTTELPDWAKETETRKGDIRWLVVASQQYATEDDARRDAALETRKLLSQDFAQIYNRPGEFVEQLPLETLRRIAVKKESVEKVERDFGSFTAPMYRVRWLVELSPIVRTELYPLWRAQVQGFRTLIVGGSFLAATLVLAGISLVSRRRRPEPTPPMSPADKSSAVVMGVGAATLIAERCKRWWRSQ